MELTKEEAQVLLNLINIAVKTVGLQAAEAGVHFAKKLEPLLDLPKEQVSE